jgi:hypothetical protein
VKAWLSMWSWRIQETATVKTERRLGPLGRTGTPGPVPVLPGIPDGGTVTA